MPNKEATTVAEALVRHTFCLLGLPRQILTDLGSEFQNHIMQEVLQTMHVTQLKTTSFHPACNGRGERVHRTLNALMSKLVADNQKDWARLLPQCTFAYNVSRSEATNYTPYYLMHGREAICPLDIVLRTPPSEESQTVTEFVEKMQQRFQSAFDCVLKQQKSRTERMKRAYDANVKKRSFSVGQFVWYFYPRTPIGHASKWQRFYIGPYRIERVINDVNYVIRRTPRARPVTTHVDKLKLFHGPDPPGWGGVGGRHDSDVIAPAGSC